MWIFMYLCYRIIVGAPKGTFPGGLNVGAPGSNSALRTGLVYQCPVSPSTCTGVFGTGTGTDKRLFDDERKCLYSRQYSTMGMAYM